MTNQNNAAQAAEQAIKAAIRKAYDDGYNDAKMAPDNCSTYSVERAVRLDSAALLSKLRAPVADERAAFPVELSPEQEEQFSKWVGVEKMTPWQRSVARLAKLLNTTNRGLIDYGAAQHFANELMSRAALASAPVAGEARMPTGYRVKVVDGHGYRITPPTGGDWVAHSDTPAGDLIAALLAAPQARPSDDELWDQTLAERDEYHDMADKLADAIADHLLVEIGEHSSSNCPWMRALDAIQNAAPQASEAERAEAPRLAKGCHRSHPHENMSPECEAKTIQARADNAAAQASEAVRDAALDRARSLREVTCRKCGLQVISSCGGNDCPTKDRYADLRALSAQPAAIRNPLIADSSGNPGELSAQPAAEPLSNPKQFALTAAENIRTGAPYDDPAFEALCREHGIWGTAEAALCAVFWRQAGQQRAAGDERTAFEATYQADYDDPGAACEREHFGKGYRAGILATRHRDDSQQASEPEPKRFVILKESGSRFAYINDTELGRTVKRFDVLKGDGWGKAERLATRLNAQHDSAGLAAQSAKEQNDAN